MPRVPLVVRYGVALAAVALAIGLKLLIDPLVVQETPFLLVFAAVMVSAWFGGLGPGLLATALAALVTDYLFLHPINTFSGFSVDGLPLGVFVLEGLLVSFVISALRNARERAEASIREARSRREDLGKSEERYRAVVEQTAECLFLFDTGTKRILETNAAFRELFGYTAAELAQMRIYDVVEDDPASVDAHVRRNREQGRHDLGERRYRCKDGSVVDVEVSGSVISYEGREAVLGIAHDVTERKGSERALRESEERLRLAAEATGLGTWDYDPVSGEFGWDERCKEIFGLPPDAVVDQETFVATLHPEERERVDGAVRRALDPASGGHYDIEYRIFAVRDGVGRWVADQGQVVFNEEGGAVRFVGTFLDVTGRKRVEEAQRFLAEVGTVLASSLDHHRTLSRLARLVVPDLADWCAVDVVADDGSLRRVAVVHQDPEKVGLARQLQEDYPPGPDAPHGLAQVLRSGRAELIPEITDELLERADLEEGHREILRKLELRSYMVVPLVARGRMLGAITFVVAESGRRYGSEDLELAEELARQAAMAVDNARLYSSMRESEERFRLLVEGVKDYAIFMLDPEGRVTTWNQGAKRINGYEAQEILGRHFSAFYTEEDIERCHPEEELRVAAAEGRYEEERLRVRKDGSRFWANVVITALRDDEGDLRGFSKVVRDITGRKRAENELRRSLDALLALHEAGQVLGSTLERGQIGSKLLEITQRISNLQAACIDLRDEDQQLSTLRAIGSEDLRRWARSAPGAEAAHRAALETARHRTFELPLTGENEPRLMGLYLPLRVRNRVIGLLEAYGPEALAEKGTVETLTSLANQGASYLENARLYEELADRQRELQDLVGRLLVAQDEERRRVAYEVHDGLTQMMVVAHQRLQMFAEDFPPGSVEGREELEELIRLVRQTVSEARRVIAALRPTALDDFGLATAVRLQVEEMRAGGYEASYEEALGGERLPVALETALFRVAQEALTNARKHAETERVRVALRRRGGAVRLEVRDWGRGFRASEVASGGPGERVGLSSMRERIALLGGDLEVRSEPGEGTSVAAEVPLTTMEEAGHGR